MASRAEEAAKAAQSEDDEGNDNKEEETNAPSIHLKSSRDLELWRAGLEPIPTRTFSHVGIQVDAPTGVNGLAQAKVPRVAMTPAEPAILPSPPTSISMPTAQLPQMILDIAAAELPSPQSKRYSGVSAASVTQTAHSGIITSTVYSYMRTHLCYSQSLKPTVTPILVAVSSAQVSLVLTCVRLSRSDTFVA